MYCDTGVFEMNILILVSDFKACSYQKKMMKINQIYVTKKGSDKELTPETSA